MTALRSSYRMVGGELAYFLGTAPGWVGEGAPVLLCVGYSGTVESSLAGETGAMLRKLGAVAPTLSIGAGGTSTFGNDTAVAAVEASMEGFRAIWGATRKVTLVGLSMGFCDLMGWARQHPDEVAGAISVVGLTDLTEQWTTNRDLGGGVLARPTIDAAYGARIASSGTTNGSTTVTTVSAISADQGKRVTGAGIQADTTITAVTPGVGFTLSKTATATGVAVALTVGGYLPATHTATRAPLAYTESLPFPVTHLYSTTDTLVPLATSLAYGDLDNVTAHPLGALDHGSASIGAAHVHPEFVAALRDYLAAA